MCIWIYVLMCVHVCKYTCIYIYLCVCVSILVYMYLFVCVRICKYTCICVFMCVHVCKYTCICECGGIACNFLNHSPSPLQQVTTFFFLHLFVYVCICGVHVCSTCVETRGQLAGVGSLSTMWVLGIKLRPSHQTWRQAPLPAEPSCLPLP